jgi:hypothetical protein
MEKKSKLLRLTMRSLFYPFLLIAVLSICDSLLSQNVNLAYSFPVRPGQDKWNNLKTEAQRIEALQVPDSILINMSDESYVETLINFPLYGYFTAFDNNKIGFDVMLTRFNIFDKMCQKKNIGSLLLNAYAAADMSGFGKYGTNYKSDLWTIKLNYVEILLSHKGIINSLSEKDKIHLLQVALDNFYSKQNDVKFSSLYGVETTLALLAADLDNLKGLENISTDKKLKIHDFINTANLKEAETITDIIESTQVYLKNK